MHHIFVLIQVNSIICISRFIFEADVFSVVGVPSIAMAHSVIERNHRDMTTRGQQNIKLKTCLLSSSHWMSCSFSDCSQKSTLHPKTELSHSLS